MATNVNDIPPLWRSPAFRYGILGALAFVVVVSITCGIVHRRHVRGVHHALLLAPRRATVPLPPKPVMWDAYMSEECFEKDGQWTRIIPLSAIPSMKPTAALPLPAKDTSPSAHLSSDGPVQVAVLVAMPSQKRSLAPLDKLDDRELPERLGGALEMGVASLSLERDP